MNQRHLPWNFAGAIAYLKSFTDYEQLLAIAPGRSVFDLARLHRLLDRLGAPQRDGPVVHVTGTKGKTSTTWMVDAILRAHGLRTFRFTSPHVETVNERIAIGGLPLSEDAFARLIFALKPEIERLRFERRSDLPSFFEIMTVMGFLSARIERAEASVVEVGLGGRLDATNVVDPCVSVITSVALDHERILGPDLPSIAREKAGIIKPGRPVIAGLPPDHPGLPAVTERARALGSPLAQRGRDYDVVRCRIETDRVRGPSLQATLRIRDRIWEGLRLRAGAGHQAWNAAYAIDAANIALLQCGRTPDAGKTLEALAALTVPCRAEFVPGAPSFLLDGAHTAESVEAVAAVARDLASGRPMVALLGLTRDRNPCHVLKALAETAQASILAPLPTPRTGNPEEQARLLSRAGLSSETAPGVEQGLDRAAELAGAEGLVVASGSLYLAGAVRTILRDRGLLASQGS